MTRNELLFIKNLLEEIESLYEADSGLIPHQIGEDLLPTSLGIINNYLEQNDE